MARPEGQKLIAQDCYGHKQHAKLLAQGCYGHKQHAKLSAQDCYEHKQHAKLSAQDCYGHKLHALKGQKLLAQGSALGIRVISKAPCKGKSFMYSLDF